MLGGQVLGNTASLLKIAPRSTNHSPADQDVDQLATVPDPARFGLDRAGLEQLLEQKAAATEPGGVDEGVESLTDHDFPGLIQRGEEGLVAFDQSSVFIQAEIHGRRILVQVRVAVLQFFELAVDLAQLLVKLGELARA